MRIAAWAALALLTGCTGPTLIRSGPKPNENVEQQYVRAVAHLDPGNRQGSLDSAVTFLDAYLAYAGHIEHRTEAAAMRRLAGSALQLARVEAALQQARASATETRGRTGDTAAKGSDEDSLKEIARLRDELAAANAELERIKKRLATPKP